MTKIYSFPMPNLINDIGLSPAAYRLYAHISRVVSDSCSVCCAQSIKIMAKECGLSTSTVVKAKNELLEVGLIKIEIKDEFHGEYPGHIITIVDIIDFAKLRNGEV